MQQDLRYVSSNSNQIIGSSRDQNYSNHDSLSHQAFKLYHRDSSHSPQNLPSSSNFLTVSTNNPDDGISARNPPFLLFESTRAIENAEDHRYEQHEAKFPHIYNQLLPPQLRYEPRLQLQEQAQRPRQLYDLPLSQRLQQQQQQQQQQQAHQQQAQLARQQNSSGSSTANILTEPTKPSVSTKSTISADQTSTSDFAKQILRALKSKEPLLKQTEILPIPIPGPYTDPPRLPPTPRKNFSLFNPPPIPPPVLGDSNLTLGETRHCRGSRGNRGLDSCQDYPLQSLRDQQNETELIKMTQDGMNQQPFMARQYRKEQSNLQDQASKEQISLVAEASSTQSSDSTFFRSLPAQVNSKASQSQEIGETLPPDLQSLQDYIRILEVKAQSLQDLERQKEPSRFQVLHRIIQDEINVTYFDQPGWAIG